MLLYMCAQDAQRFLDRHQPVVSVRKQERGAFNSCAFSLGDVKSGDPDHFYQFAVSIPHNNSKPFLLRLTTTMYVEKLEGDNYTEVSQETPAFTHSAQRCMYHVFLPTRFDEPGEYRIRFRSHAGDIVSVGCGSTVCRAV